jgi:hypothetical protein
MQGRHGVCRRHLQALTAGTGRGALWAVGWQLSIHAHMGLRIANFFSYFTNLSNLFAAFVLLRDVDLGALLSSVRR